jgi:kynurenine 3-monooxygenase
MASGIGMSAQRQLTIVGAGLAGALLATLLARRGWSVDVFERRGDPRIEGYAGGRSINLALAERGLHALRSADAADAVREHAVMMRGRMVHFLDGGEQLQRYGRDDSEVIWSVSRGELNITLIDAAEAAGARLHFDRRLDAVDFDARMATFLGDGHAHMHRFEALLGADGAGSAVRQQMQQVAPLGERMAWLDHGYKELEIPPAFDGESSLRHSRHRPRPGMTSAAIAIASPRLIHRSRLRRACSSPLWLIVRPFQAAGGAPQAPSSARCGCRPAPSPRRRPKG